MLTEYINKTRFLQNNGKTAISELGPVCKAFINNQFNMFF